MESKRLIVATAALGLALGIAGCAKKSTNDTTGSSASGSQDTTVRLWDLDTGRARRVFEGQAIGVASVAVSPVGMSLPSGSSDNSRRRWAGGTGGGGVGGVLTVLVVGTGAAGGAGALGVSG